MNERLAGRGAGLAWAERAGWLVALAAVVLVLALGRYESRDPDSALHAAIASDIASQPVREWIVPRWGGLWSLEGLYREHPAGVFLLPALAARLGYPSEQAAYAVNAIYQVLTLFLMMALARRFLSERDARVVVTLMLLVPIAFTYRIRANQEQPLLMFLLAALLGVERSRTSLKWAALSAVGFAGQFLIKGVFVTVGIAASVAWLAVRQWWWPDQRSRRRAWLGLALAGASLLGLAAAYEAAYTAVAGERFFPWYTARQFGVAFATGSAHPVRGALHSFVWYLGRIAWYAAPWTVAALIGCWRGARRLGQPRPEWTTWSAARQGVALAAIVAGTYLVAFSVFERRADRYIFSAYYFLAAWWAAYGLRLFPAVRRLAWRFTRALYPYEQALIWLGSVVLALLAALLQLPKITLWR